MAERGYRESSTVWQGVKLAFGGCIVMPILVAFFLSACFVLATH